MGSAVGRARSRGFDVGHELPRIERGAEGARDNNARAEDERASE